MFAKWFGKQKHRQVVLLAPLTGRVIPLEEVPDPAFAQKIVGDGVAILPAEGNLLAPVSGNVIALLESGHAIGMRSEDGLEILLHIGIDTVKLQGRGFMPRVRVGDRVAAGELLIRFDLALLQDAGFSPVTPVLITNEQQVVSEKRQQTDIDVRAGVSPLITVTLKERSQH